MTKETKSALKDWGKAAIIAIGVIALAIFCVVISHNSKEKEVDNFIVTEMQVGTVTEINDGVATVRIVGIDEYVPEEELKVGDTVRIISEDGMVIRVERMAQ